MVHFDLKSMRETVVVGMIALFLGFAVYTLLALAWTFKASVEAAEKLRHSLDRPA